MRIKDDTARRVRPVCATREWTSPAHLTATLDYTMSFDANADVVSSLKLLFWNLNIRPVSTLVAKAVREHDVQVIVLAECNIPISNLLIALNSGQRSKFNYPFAPSDRLKILTRLPRAALRPLKDPLGASLRRLRPPLLPEILLVAAHLPSKLYLSSEDQAHGCMQLIRVVEETEIRLGHRRTIVIGDFNMHPFDSGMVGSSGFHAAMSRTIARRGQRTVQGVERGLFYNPMWSHFGDRGPSPPGTYFYSSSSPISFFWHMFDQVLIRPELIDNVCDDDVEIITSIGGQSLLKDTGVPDRDVGSDHLPLVVRLSLP